MVGEWIWRVSGVLEREHVERQGKECVGTEQERCGVEVGSQVFEMLKCVCVTVW